MKLPRLILAPLRGVTTRCFRETFAPELREAGFEEATTPFIPAMPGVDPAKDRELEMMKQMSRQKDRGSAGDYQADEQAGVARLTWRVSGR